MQILYFCRIIMNKKKINKALILKSITKMVSDKEAVRSYIKVLSLPNPYNYSFDDETGTYQFTTKNDIIYRVAFLEDSTLTTVSSTGMEFNNVYQVVVEKVSEQLEPLDSQVFLTIDTIISDFFSNIENALIYERTASLSDTILVM